MNTDTTATPHDAIFKTFLNHPATARDFLRLHLPASLQKLCDLNTLQLESGSFIEDDLRAYYSDVLWSLKTREAMAIFTPSLSIRVPPMPIWHFG